MTPPPDHDHPCLGCFLQEQRQGGVCPAAREVYSLEDVQEAFRGEVLHAAVRQEVSTAQTLIELVRIDSRQAHQEVRRAALLLAAAPVQPAFQESRKEPHVVVRSHPLQ